MPYVTMCQGPKCTANGAGLIIRDMEDLAFGVACVEASGCMGQCSKGPNGMYSEKSGAKGRITNKLNKYSKLTDMLNDVIQGYSLNDLQSRVHRVKFAIRREDNAEVRQQAIEETLTSFDESQRKTHPELVAQMLCLRSREKLKADPPGAFADLREALTLHPDWPWAFVTLAQVLDSLHMPRGALASMQKAIEIGTGVDKQALSRGIVRLERKAADSKGPDVPPPGIEMDIKYVADKALADTESGKKDKKEKKEEDKTATNGGATKEMKSKAKSKGKSKAKKAKAENSEVEASAAVPEGPKSQRSQRSPKRRKRSLPSLKSQRKSL
ncbi:unnamed protein product [Effrenium voratum]|nr:unnamed protein product [Effrenium voratum]